MATTQSTRGPEPAAAQAPDLPTTERTSGAIVRRELLFLGIALLLGFVLIPLAIWLVGSKVLGPYTHGLEPAGGPMRLLGDFYEGLAHGSVIFWCVGFGPYFLLAFVRLFWGVISHRPGAPPSADASLSGDRAPRSRSDLRREPPLGM